MKKNDFTILLLILLSSVGISCNALHEEFPECPHLRVEVNVKDKNYANVSKVPLAQAVPEDLPFREYVGTLCWILADVKTGRIVAEHRACDVKDDSRSVLLDLGNDFPYGEYSLTIWGNLSEHEPLGDDHTTIAFHPAHAEGGDVYMTCDTLLYDAAHTFHSVEMERTKGKLLIEKVDIPEALKVSEKRISGVFGNLDTDFNYGGETHVVSRTVIGSESHVITSTLLTPSVCENGSTVSLSFGDGSRAVTGYPDPDDVAITMKRNELTVLRYVWDADAGMFKIYVLVNAAWEEVINLELE